MVKSTSYKITATQRQVMNQLLDTLAQQPGLSKRALSDRYGTYSDHINHAVRLRQALLRKENIALYPPELNWSQIQSVLRHLAYIKLQIESILNEAVIDGVDNINFQCRLFDLRSEPVLMWKKWLGLNHAQFMLFQYRQTGRAKQPITNPAILNCIKPSLWSLWSALEDLPEPKQTLSPEVRG